MKRSFNTQTYQNVEFSSTKIIIMFNLASQNLSDMSNSIIQNSKKY